MTLRAVASDDPLLPPRPRRYPCRAESGIVRDLVRFVSQGRRLWSSPLPDSLKCARRVPSTRSSKISVKKDPSKPPRETNGPVVKTGPTAGQNRSRNQDGTWRQKRSDAGQPKKSGCFLTTAACEYKGLPDDCYELQTLRRFRDDYLAATPRGRALIEEYYDVAPAIAHELSGTAALAEVWEVVASCVGKIDAGRNEEAKAAYVAMVERLAKAVSADAMTSTQ